ncbi:hypothetical protein [Muricoccus radiodurans]
MPLSLSIALATTGLMLGAPLGLALVAGMALARHSARGRGR